MSKNILLLGAGRSTASLIHYLLDESKKNDWNITLVERNAKFAKAKTNGHSNARILSFDIEDQKLREKHISEADIVISMLPVRFHALVIEDCIALKKNMVTASYISPKIAELNSKAVEAGITVVMEMGVDPGIDHMSAMQLIDRIRNNGGKMLLFESFTGGLVAPESDNNPWNYKFTWNPRNVVLAGQGSAAKFIQKGKYKYIPYHQLFRRTEYITIDGYGKFEGYANRDSLNYRSVYALDDIQTLYRGTLRRPGFSRAWDFFVKLGATDDSYIMEGSKNMTHREFINSFLAYDTHNSVELKFRHYLNIPQDDPIIEKFEWLGIFEDTAIGINEDKTPAQILQHILEQKWNLADDDKDMIVMWHKLGWKSKDGSMKAMTSSMVVKGEDRTYTSMAKTVGLPVAIATKMVLEGKINNPGIHRPVTPDIYEPILNELKEFGISFVETETA
ncbi:MAG: saccharopine dehydrogenase [Crocinitomicaceae bacterium]|nr:saccharopine dehydrogenase [Crocinitomicaceae bacterium]